MTEVVPVVVYIVLSIHIDLILVGKDDFRPFGFPADMVHRPQNAFHLVIGSVADCLPVSYTHLTLPTILLV